MLHHLEKLFYPIPTKIIYCYGQYQKEFDKLPPNVEMVEGFPNNLSDMLHGHDHRLIVLDDLVSQIPTINVLLTYLRLVCTIVE